MTQQHKYIRHLERISRQEVLDLWNELNENNHEFSLDQIVLKFSNELTKKLEFLN